MIGDPPDKSSPEFVKNNGDILRDAERYQVRKLTLADFKQQMGYQKSSSVEHFGEQPSTTSSRAGQGRQPPAKAAADTAKTGLQAAGKAGSE